MALTKTQKTIIRILLVEKSSTRTLLASKLALTNAALTLALKPLISDGLVLEARSKISQKVGRRELHVALNPNYGSFLSIDVRKHHSYFNLIDFSGELISSSDDTSVSLEGILSENKTKLLGIGITIRGEASLGSFKTRYPELFSDVQKSGIPYFVFNNVDCLASIYSLSHHDDKNFLLVKYGPGLGSSIYTNGKPLGATSELGHTFYQDKTVEDTISYSSILGKEVEEKEGLALIQKDKEKLNKILAVLSFALCNADSLLSLQKVILSGALLTSDDVIALLKKQIISLKPDFDLTKICVYENYQEINEIKGALGAFNKTFGE